MANIEEIRPHITLAVYNSELPVENYINSFRFFTENLTQIEVNFDILSTFPPNEKFHTSVVFMPPTITSHLYETHRQFYKELIKYNSFANELYVPERWNPHCTLAIGLDKQSLFKTFEYCISHFRPLEGKIKEIALVKIDLVDGIPISKTIFSTLLN
ncbi:2'-5' RNA ligase family protein [Fredinandcohnia sp. 179-A 10B2 NHS]|uniref:2'-5' RNA ligase family protein n=1 Tax=Fredinandcohnia sp. 179-A 10B2 NHS TaxID=3235176 RepID=UPI0039A34AE4